MRSDVLWYYDTTGFGVGVVAVLVAAIYWFVYRRDARGPL